MRAGAEDSPVPSLEANKFHLLGATAKHRFTPEADEEAVNDLCCAQEIDPDFVPAIITLSIVLLFAAKALAGNIGEARAWFGRFASETRHCILNSLYLLDEIGNDPAWGP